jgi:hypothetical protein
MTDHVHDFDYCCQRCYEACWGGDTYCRGCGTKLDFSKVCILSDAIIMTVEDARQAGYDC